MKTKKYLGQHFLNSEPVIDDIIKAAGEISGKNILEIGPGQGALTKSILLCNPKNLFAIEVDHECLPYHQRLLSQYKNYELLKADALQINEADFLLPPMKVIANLPYNISMPLLGKWLDNITIFESLTLMFQKEVAERIVAGHGNKQYGKISVMTQLLGKAEYLFTVPRHLFSPAPQVDSAVIKITPYDKPLFDVEIVALKDLLRRLFCYRRKMVHTILKNVFHNTKEVLGLLGIDMKARPENLSIEQFCQLTHHLK